MTVYYHLGKFPPEELEWSKLIPLLGPASAAVARYDGTLSAIPNAAVLLASPTWTIPGGVPESWFQSDTGTGWECEYS